MADDFSVKGERIAHGFIFPAFPEKIAGQVIDVIAHDTVTVLITLPRESLEIG